MRVKRLLLNCVNNKMCFDKGSDDSFLENGRFNGSVAVMSTNSVMLYR